MPSLQAPKAYSTKGMTISNTAVAISHASFSWGATDLADADQAVITAHSQPMTITWDGTTPTATVGMYIAAGSTVTIKGNANVQAVKLIRQSGTDATASITLEKFV